MTEEHTNRIIKNRLNLTNENLFIVIQGVTAYLIQCCKYTYIFIFHDVLSSEICRFSFLSIFNVPIIAKYYTFVMN